MADESYATIVQAQTIADTLGAWTQSAEFAQFDPSLGTLLNVNLGLTASIEAGIAIENLEAAPASFGVGFGTSVYVSGPTGSSRANTVLDSVSANTRNTTALGAYDGANSYSGPSGTTLSGIGATATQDAVLQAGSSGTSGFVGTRTATLPVTASSVVDVVGPANMQVQSQASAGAVLTLDYNFGAPGSAGSGDDSGSVITDAYNYDSASIAIAGADWLTTAPQTFSFGDATTGWDNIVDAQQFNPALGILERVNLTVSDDIVASVAAQNLDPTAGFIATSQTAVVSLDYPGTASPAVSSSAAVSFDGSLAAYGGGADFTGPSSAMQDDLTAQSGPYAGKIDSGLAAFVGAGTVDLPIVSSSTATLQGPGNLLAQILAQSGATVTVSYTYQPIPEITGAGNAVSDIAGLAAIADPSLGLSDADTDILTGATVAITGGLAAGDTLAVDEAGLAASGITAAYDSADGTLVLSGAAPLAAYQTALQSVVSRSTSADPTQAGSDPSRTLTWAVSDHDDTASMPVTTTIDVQPPGVFAADAVQAVVIDSPGTYTVGAAQSAGSVTLDAPGATLVLDAPLTVAGTFLLEAGTLEFNGGSLSVAGSYDQTGGLATGTTVDISASGGVAITGGTLISPGAINLYQPGDDNLEDGVVMTAAGDISPVAPLLVLPIMETSYAVSVVTVASVDVTDGTTSVIAVAPVPVPAAVNQLALPPPVMTGSAIDTFLPSPQSAEGGTLTLLRTGPAAASYPGAATTESLGFTASRLAGISGAGPGTPDVWQMMTQTDIANTGSVLDVLLNPANQRWVALTAPQNGPLDSGVLLGGGPMTALANFLSHHNLGT